MKKTIKDYPKELQTRNHELIMERGRAKGRKVMREAFHARIKHVKDLLDGSLDHSVHDMAKEMHLSERTIKNYIRRLEYSVGRAGIRKREEAE